MLSTDDGSITIYSIKRSQGNPSYKGNIELALYDEGIAVINEIDIEDYLKKVVPSEMPVSFGVNALKVRLYVQEAMHIHSLRIIITVSMVHT